jgi:hypothetical protein
MNRETVAWILVAWTIVGMLITVLTIGRHREPLTPGVACISLVISVGYLWALMYATGI